MTMQLMYENALQLPEEGLQEFAEIPAQLSTGQSVIIMGDTGSGKSTLINLLARVPLQAICNRAIGKMMITTEDPLPQMKIGCTLLAETSRPNRWDDGQGTIYWDCPGWQDNRGPVQEMTNALVIKKVFATSEKVKILILMPETYFTAPRATQLLVSIETLGHLLPRNLEPLKESIALVVSQADSIRSETHIIYYISCVLSEVKISEKARVLLQIFKQQPITIFKRPSYAALRQDVDRYPLDTTSLRAELLLKINNLRYAARVDVKTPLSPTYQRVVQKSHIALVEKINRALAQLMQIFKHSLKKFTAPAFQPLNQTERQKLQELIVKSLKIFDRLIEIAPSKETFPILIEGYTSLASTYGAHLPTDEITCALQTLPAVEQLEEFIDTEIKVLLNVSQAFCTMRDARELLKEAQMSLVAMEAEEIKIKNKQEADQGEKKLQVHLFIKNAPPGLRRLAIYLMENAPIAPLKSLMSSKM